MTPTHPTVCPKCGKQLTPIALGADTAPWACFDDGIGFWSCELTTSARALYRPQYNDWGLTTARVSMLAEIELEFADAVTRGTSLREDQFTLAPLSQLENLAGRHGLGASFLALLQVEIKNRGGH